MALYSFEVSFELSRHRQHSYQRSELLSSTALVIPPLGTIFD